MFHKITKLIPHRTLVFLWQKMPVPIKTKKYFMKKSNRHFLVAVLGLIENEKGEILLLKHTYRKEP